METNTAVTQLAALAHPTRLDIFRALVVSVDSGLSADTLADRLNVSPQVLSFHLKELRYAALVDCESLGRFVIYRARYNTMNALLAFLTKNCCAQSISDRESVCYEPVMANQSVINPSAIASPTLLNREVLHEQDHHLSQSELRHLSQRARDDSQQWH